MILMLIISRRRNSERYSDQGPWLDTSQASSSEMKFSNGNYPIYLRSSSRWRSQVCDELIMAAE